MNKISKKSKTITWGKRLVLVVLILAGIFYGVLNFAERSKDAVRLGLQDYLTQATGHNAVITDMEHLELSPNLVFKMNGISISDKENTKKTLAVAKNFYIAMPFWKMLLGQSHYIGLEVHNLELASGYILPQRLSISFAGISDSTPENNNPLFLIEGTYNQKPVLITMELYRRTTKEYYLYSLPSFSEITFKIGDVEGRGELEQGFTTLSLNNVEVKHGGGLAKFDVTNIQKSPFSVDLKGSINDIPVYGLLTKSDENINLMITPKTNESFIKNVIKEIGIDDSHGFKLEFSDHKNLQIQEQ